MRSAVTRRSGTLLRLRAEFFFNFTLTRTPITICSAYKAARRSTPNNVATWSRWGQAKICVKVNSEAELLEIEAIARAQRLVTHVVMDAGRTHIESGSLTVLAIGPAPVADLDRVTGHLKLL